MNGIYLDAGGPQALEFLLPELHKSFGGDQSVAAYKARTIELLAHPWARASVRTLVLRDERGGYLSYLHLHAVRAVSDDREIWMGGISGLITPERLRGEGHGTALLRLTLELLAQEEVDGAFLWSSVGDALIRPLGFHPMNAGMVDIPLSALPEGKEGAVAARRIQANDWSALHAIHHRSGAQQPLWFLRDASRWDYLVSRWTEESSGGRFLGHVALIGDRIVAYVLTRTDGRDLRLLEFGMEAPDREVLHALLGAVRGAGGSLGCARFISPWPPGTWGALFDPLFEPVRNPDVLYLAASPGSKLNLPAIAARGGGYWETDRI